MWYFCRGGVTRTTNRRGRGENAATESYFETLRSKSGIVVTEEQKRWWQQAKRQHGCQ